MTRHRDETLATRRAGGGLRGPTPAAGGRARQVCAPPQSSLPSSLPHRDHEGYLIKELQQRLRTQIEARIRAKGLWMSFPHSVVLMSLQEEPGLSGAQLARRNSVTAQTMNGLLMPLETKGLIERRPDPENARILKCYLKPLGQRWLKQGAGEAAMVFEQMLGKLSERERTEFRQILRRCIDALQPPDSERGADGRKPGRSTRVVARNPR